MPKAAENIHPPKGAGPAAAPKERSGGRRRPTVQDSQDDSGDSIEGLFSYHLQILANVSTRIALLSIRPEFGLNIMQWRTLANLDRRGPGSLQAIARASGVLTSQMSRTVSQLVARGLVAKTADAKDARSRRIALTPQGRALVRRVLKVRRAVNARMLANLDPDERQALVSLIRRVEGTSRMVYAEMRRRNGGEVVFDV